MNKNELISSIASETGLTKTDAAKAVDAFVSSISSALKSGDEVRLVGFGTFAVSKRSATTGRNPRTGQSIKFRLAINRNSELVKYWLTLLTNYKKGPGFQPFFLN